jgi:membrane-anchored protein YejM (alkaline phosphatase superfamily)
LAFRLQSEAPEAIDLSSETEETQELYGLNKKETQSFGKNCLMARRLVERGVRFVQLYHGTGSKWDAHSDIEKNHSRLCLEMDQPVAGLLTDLKRRGMLKDTLVVWGGEFGRTPMSEKGNGRDHNPTGFSMFMAGGGIKGGQVIGATDELGLYAIEDKMHVHDIHASILWLLGLDHMKLSYNNRGRLERPTINEGRFERKLIG